MKRFKFAFVVIVVLAIMSFGSVASAANHIYRGTASWDEDDGWILDVGSDEYKLDFDNADIDKDLEWLWLDAEDYDLISLDVKVTGAIDDEETIIVDEIAILSDIDIFRGTLNSDLELEIANDEYGLIGNIDGLDDNDVGQEVELEGIEVGSKIFVLSYKVNNEDDKDERNKQNRHKFEHRNFGQINAYFKQMLKNRSNVQARTNLAARLQAAYGKDFRGLIELLGGDNIRLTTKTREEYIQEITELYSDLYGDSELDDMFLPKLAKLYKDRGDKEVKLFIKGKQSQTEVSPAVTSGRSLVPLRVVAEELGAKVVYYGNTQKIEITHGGTTVALEIGSKVAYLDGEKVNLDVAPTVVNGRTMVPIRFIADAFDVNISWYDGIVTVD